MEQLSRMESSDPPCDQIVGKFSFREWAKGRKDCVKAGWIEKAFTKANYSYTELTGSRRILDMTFREVAEVLTIAHFEVMSGVGEGAVQSVVRVFRSLGLELKQGDRDIAWEHYTGRRTRHSLISELDARVTSLNARVAELRAALETERKRNAALKRKKNGTPLIPFKE